MGRPGAPGPVPTMDPFVLLRQEGNALSLFCR